MDNRGRCHRLGWGGGDRSDVVSGADWRRSGSKGRWASPGRCCSHWGDCVRTNVQSDENDSKPWSDSSERVKQGQKCTTHL